jgi:hypothetical protein
MTENGAAPNPLGQRDAASLVGVLAVLEGHLLTGDLDPHVVEHLARRVLPEHPGTAGPAELRLALSDLNHRLRYVLGEYAEPPLLGTGQVALHVGFANEAAARAFADTARTAGERVAAPVQVDGRAYDDGSVGWQVDVRTTGLPLSAGFDAHVERLRRLAAEHGGHDGGWSTTPT